MHESTEPTGLRRYIWRALLILLGAALYAFGVEMFYAPAGLTTGGLTGISLILNKLVHLPVGVMTFVMNIPLFFLGYKSMGRFFFVLSVVGVLASSLWIDLFAVILPAVPAFADDRMLCCVLGGAITGLGLGVIMAAGGSTGGTDIVGLLLSRKHEELSLGRVILITDVVIVVANTVIFKDLSAAGYTAIAMYIATVVIDAVMYGANIASVALIITKKTDEIADLLIHSLQRGVTILNGTGAYTHTPQSMLVCAVSRRQLSHMKQLVRMHDPNAFIIITEAREVLGNGFKAM